MGKKLIIGKRMNNWNKNNQEIEQQNNFFWSNFTAEVLQIDLQKVCLCFLHFLYRSNQNCLK
jgi:hypothetical protein